MSDFYKARFRAVYTPQDEGATAWTVAYPGQLMPEPPAREWSAEMASHNLVGCPYGLDEPAGNARLTYEWEALIQRGTTAKLERDLRRIEIALNTQRKGKLEMAEAYHAGTPTLLTRWVAVVNSCTVRPLTLDEAPAKPGSWGAVRVSFTLTWPEEL